MIMVIAIIAALDLGMNIIYFLVRYLVRHRGRQ